MPDDAVATIHLKPGREKPILDGHPWIYSGAVACEEGPDGAQLARVRAANGEELGVGLLSPRSQIRVRMLAGPGEWIDRGFFRSRLEAAARLRERVVGAETTGYRLLNAEGDGVPGWVVDRFGDVLVSQVTVAGLEALRGEAYAALAELLPDCAILQLNDLATRRREGLPAADEAIAGEPPAEARFTESGLVFTAELAGGQKTGFYCDQRDNRRRAETLAGGARVLDLFAHSGAFALYALRGGAIRAVCVESSPRLVARGGGHLELNGMDPERVEWVEGDAFEFLRGCREKFDLVVCDPPPLVRRRAELDRGARAYKDANRLALARLAPGGFLLTFSCSAAVDAKLLRQILFAAAREAGVRLSLLAPLGAAPDHPVSVFHPEGEYLRGWLGTVAGPRA